MLMPNADEKYFENSKVLTQTYKSKLSSPSPKKSFVGKVSGIFANAPQFAENPEMKSKLTVKIEEVAMDKDSDSDITSP